MEAVPCRRGLIYVYLQQNLDRMEFSGDYRYMSMEMFIVLLKTIRPSNRPSFTETHVANGHVWEGRRLHMRVQCGDKCCMVTWKHRPSRT